MGRVIIVQPVKFDMRSAESSGEVVCLFDKAPSPFNTAGFISAVRTKIRDLQFDSGEDYFCVAGSTLDCSFALVAFLSEFPDGIKVLMFDASIGEYRIRKLETERSVL